jgi:hypothetical protein
MGLKSGSRDAGLDDGEEETDSETTGADEETTATGAGEPPTEGETPEGSSGEADASDSSERPSMDAIPYKLRRDKVNEGRQQVPYFLREDVIEAEDDLQDALEAMVGESVYKSDYREAAMVVAQRNPELVAEVLREWGYDLD